MDTSLTNIWCAWRRFRRGKKPSRAILLFESDLESNLLHLCADINNGSYRHGGYDHKIINEKKRRDIHVASARDRIVHRLLYDYLITIVDKRLDDDIWSCRVGKGLHGALSRTAALSHKYKDSFVWRADVTKFFDNVRHSELKRCLRRFVGDKQIVWLLDEVIDSYHTDHRQTDRQTDRQTGIPIGNLTSQLFANVYLNELDRHVRHVIRPLAYVRYGDDTILYFHTSEEAVKAQTSVSNWLHVNLGLSINPSQSIVVSARAGLHFLGHHIFTNHEVVVDKLTVSKALNCRLINTYSSYQAQRLTNKDRKVLYWRGIG